MANNRQNNLTITQNEELEKLHKQIEQEIRVHYTNQQDEEIKKNLTTLVTRLYTENLQAFSQDKKTLTNKQIKVLSLYLVNIYSMSQSFSTAQQDQDQIKNHYVL